MELRTGGDVDAPALAEAYARLLAEGDGDELVVVVSERVGRIDLVPERTSWYAVPFAVRIVAERGPAVLRDVPIRAAGREVLLEGLALPGLLGGSMQLAARDGIDLVACALGRVPDARPAPGCVLRVARADATPRVRLRDCVLRTSDPDAAAPVVLVETPGPAAVDAVLEGCDLGSGLQVAVDGGLRLAVSGSRCADPERSLRCAPRAVDVAAPSAGPPERTVALEALLTGRG